MSPFYESLVAMPRTPRKGETWTFSTYDGAERTVEIRSVYRKAIDQNTSPYTPITREFMSYIDKDTGEVATSEIAIVGAIA